MVESTIRYSKSGSSDIASKIRHQTPLMLHRGKRRNTLFQSPNASGRSRQGETAGAPIVANVLDRSFKEVAPDCRLHLMFGPLRAGSMLNVTTVVYLFFGA